MSPDGPALHTTTERSGRCVVVHASGELDLATTRAAEQALLDAAGGEPVDLVVDLAGVTFVDATGLGALLHAAEAVEAAGGQLRLASPSRMLRVMLRLLDLEARLPVVDGGASSST